MGQLLTTDLNMSPHQIKRAVKVIVDSVVGTGEDYSLYGIDSQLYGDMHADIDTIKAMVINIIREFSPDGLSQFEPEQIAQLKNPEITIGDVLEMISEQLL